MNKFRLIPTQRISRISFNSHAGHIMITKGYIESCKVWGNYTIYLNDEDMSGITNPKLDVMQAIMSKIDMLAINDAHNFLTEVNGNITDNMNDNDIIAVIKSTVRPLRYDGKTHLI